jgi:hypothetical protein
MTKFFRKFARGVWALWESKYSKYYLLAVLVAVTVANLLDVKVIGRGSLDADAASAIGTWFSGVLTVVTIAIAAATFREDRGRAEVQARKDAEQATKLAREAAGAVFAWLTLEQDRVLDVVTHPVLNIANRTSVPIYTWSVGVEDRNLEVSSTDYGPLFPGSSTIELRNRGWGALLEGNETPRVAITFGAQGGETLRRTYEGDLLTHESPKLIS